MALYFCASPPENTTGVIQSNQKKNVRQILIKRTVMKIINKIPDQYSSKQSCHPKQGKFRPYHSQEETLGDIMTKGNVMSEWVLEQKIDIKEM